MKIHIKNMVCQRCKTAVQQELQLQGYQIIKIDLGEAEIAEEPNTDELEALDSRLKHLGFEIIDDRKSRLVEKIKNIVIQLVHHTEKPLTGTLSEYISEQLPYDYKYLSTLFSDTEGVTIEKYYITQKIEKVKELLIYDEFTLSEIAYRMGYSSVAHLSGQFKKETGLTPTHFKAVKENRRRNIEEL